MSIFWSTEVVLVVLDCSKYMLITLYLKNLKVVYKMSTYSQLPIPRQRPFYLFDSIFVEKSFDICKTEVYLSCFLRFSFSCWVFIWSSITILSSENLRKSIEPELPPCWYAKLQTASTIGPKLWETSNGFFEIYKWLKFGEVIAEQYEKLWWNC